MTARERHLLRTYGITEDQYDALLDQQSGCCFICERPASVFRKRLCVDHNHKTGAIRGLLCNFCNRRVIGRHTNPRLFERAYQYLSRFPTGYYIPVKRKKRKKKA